MPRSPDCRSADPRRRARCAPRKPEIVFELKEYHRDVPDAQLLADLRALARRQGTASVAVLVYEREGRFAAGTLVNRFGSWNRALQAARLKIVRLRNVPQDLLIADLRRVARRLKVKWLKRTQYIALGRYTIGHIDGRFGKWDRAVEAAGIEPAWPRWVPTDRLLANLEHVWRQLGRQPTRQDMRRPVSQYSVKPYVRCFGGFRNALEAFVAWKRTRAMKTLAGKSTPAPLTRPMLTQLDTQRNTTRWINWRLRFLTMRRDGFRCRACGASPATDAGVRLEVDHIVAWSNGGETIQRNLQTLCQRCNGGKSDLNWRTSERKSVCFRNR
jgi:hypothetical protein